MIEMKSNAAKSLRKALAANAVFSGVSGLLILLAESQVVSWLGLEGLSIWPVGLMLVLFAAWLAWLCRSRRVPISTVRSVIVSDWAWVAGTVVLLTAWSSLFSFTGVVLLVDVALVVGVLAYLQGRGLAAARVAEPLAAA